jgi:hypothetical protein
MAEPIRVQGAPLTEILRYLMPKRVSFEGVVRPDYMVTEEMQSQFRSLWQSLSDNLRSSCLLASRCLSWCGESIAYLKPVTVAGR